MFHICTFLFACVLALKNNQIWDESINSLKYITENYFSRNGFIIFRERSDISELLTTGIMMKNEKKSYILMNESYPIGRNVKHFYTNDVVAIVKDQKILDVFLKNLYWNPRGKNLIILYEDLKARDVIKQVWDKTRGVDVVVMKINKTINFYTWFPYKKGECSKVRKISHLNEWKNGGFIRKGNLFPKKIPKNLKGCPVYAVTTLVPPLVMNDFTDGYEIRIADTLADFHNFKLIFIPFLRGDNESFWMTNSTVGYAGAMGLLMKHSADIAIGGLMTRSDRNEMTDMLYPHIHENLLWIFPAPRQISNFSSIYTIFSLKSWINIIFFHFMISSAFYFIVRMVPFREPDSFKGISCFFTPIAIITNNAVAKPRGIYLRFVMMIYVIYALHITAAYTSSLVVLLTEYETEKPYETVQELIDAGLFCYIFRSAVNVFINVTDRDLWDQILKPGRYKFMTGISSDHMKNEIAFKKKAYMLFPQTNIEFNPPGKYQDNRGRSLFNTIHYLSYTISIFLSPGNPLRDLLTDTLLRIMAAGLTDFWKTDINRYYGATGTLVPDDEDEEQQRVIPLSIKHLEGAFLFHFIFSICCVLVFFCEVIFHRKLV